MYDAISTTQQPRVTRSFQWTRLLSAMIHVPLINGKVACIPNEKIFWMYCRTTLILAI